jgi:hypothetical protein
MEEHTVKFIWNHNQLQTFIKTLKKYNIGGFTLPDFKPYSKATVIKTVCQ